jgi:hypothetical protein
MEFTESTVSSSRRNVDVENNSLIKRGRDLVRFSYLILMPYNNDISATRLYSGCLAHDSFKMTGYTV